MRKLPIYFLIDVSESMVGTPIQEVEQGLQSVVQYLRSDPYALETAFLSVLAFAGKAKALVPLTDVTLFTPPALPIGSGTSLADGLELLMSKIDQEVVRTTAEKKGDWKPIIFLFTDGAPTSDSSAAVKKWRAKYKDRISLVSIIFGDHADINLLDSIGQETLVLKDLSPDSFREFFKWVSASLQVSSMAAADTGKDGLRLASGNINLEKATTRQILDENYVILSMRCSKNRKLSLIKYDARQTPNKLLGAWVVNEEDYFNFSRDTESIEEISTENLADIPVCPACNSSEGFVRCGKCGQLGCSGDSKNYTCPWCGNSGTVVVCDNMNMGRNRG